MVDGGKMQAQDERAAMRLVGKTLVDGKGVEWDARLFGRSLYVTRNGRQVYELRDGRGAQELGLPPEVVEMVAAILDAQGLAAAA